MDLNTKERLPRQRQVWVRNIEQGLGVFSQAFGFIDTGVSGSADALCNGFTLEEKGTAYGYAQDPDELFLNGHLTDRSLYGDDLLVSHSEQCACHQS